MSRGAPWPLQTLGDLFDIGAGKTLNASARATQPQHPFLRTANVYWGRVDLTRIDTMHYSPDDLENKTLRKGDLLVCEGGDIGRAAIWGGQIPQCGFQNHLHRLRPKHGETVPAFFMYALQAGFSLHGTYEGAANKTTIPNLSRGRLAALQVPVPPVEEQARIAAVLFKVQRAAELEAQTLATQAEAKRAAMSQFFTKGLANGTQTETDIGPISSRWRLVRFEDACDDITVGVVVRPASHYVESGVPAFRSLNVREDRLDTSELVYFSSVANDSVLSKSKLRAGDVLVVRTGYPGTSCVVPPEFDGANCIDIVVARPKTSLVNGAFLSRFLNSEQGRIQATQSSAGLAQQHLNVGALRRVLVPLPALDEQEGIVRRLESIDRAIALTSDRGIALDQLFRSLLDRLIRGELRTDDLEIDTGEVLSA